MNYKALEDACDSEQELEKFLSQCKEEFFDKIDYHATLFKSGILSDPHQLQSTLDELTGIYMELNPIVALADTEKINRENVYYVQKKIEIENKGEKFVSSPIEKEASSYVANFRRIRNILQAYLASCEKGISSCQSKLKYLSAETHLAH